MANLPISGRHAGHGTTGLQRISAKAEATVHDAPPGPQRDDDHAIYRGAAGRPRAGGIHSPRLDSVIDWRRITGLGGDEGNGRARMVASSYPRCGVLPGLTENRLQEASARPRLSRP